MQEYFMTKGERNMALYGGLGGYGGLGCGFSCAGLWTSTAVILVLFILLVIVSRTFFI
jgi:uncharacterized protein (TIGR01732 family)